jgi:hypothetical protein
MVYYFTSNVVEPAGFIYVGKDKYESECLCFFVRGDALFVFCYLDQQRDDVNHWAI